YTFQNFLLLTAENILDDDSRYFLDSIGWTGDREWNARREGTEYQQLGSVKHIGSGFANVLNYWEEMRSSSLSLIDHEAELSSELKTDSFSAFDFTERARVVLSRRFHLDKIEIADRYFVLASEFANRAREYSPEWLDARLSVFEDLLGLIWY